MADATTEVSWQDAAGNAHRAGWRSESGAKAPARIREVDDTVRADVAWRLACEGTALLWRGDFHNARQLLQAMGRRFERSRKKRRPSEDRAEAFNLYRLTQAQRARTLGALLVAFEPGWQLNLGRAPEVAEACRQAWGECVTPCVLPLRDLLGAIGAYEWRARGVEVPALGARIHPHYGVFSPVRGEYVDLVARAPLPTTRLAFDLGTGTGVLAALLAQRGVERVIATDCAPRALACAQENLDRLGWAERVTLYAEGLFPPGRAPLIVCNPPWLPGKAVSTLDQAIYDPGSAMLTGFLDGLTAHLETDGEGWLILSDLAERLGLREPGWLPERIAAAGLKVVGRLDTKPRHGRANDAEDLFHAARAGEVISLWRLRAVG